MMKVMMVIQEHIGYGNENNFGRGRGIQFHGKIRGHTGHNFGQEEVMVSRFHRYYNVRCIGATPCGVNLEWELIKRVV